MRRIKTNEDSSDSKRSLNKKLTQSPKNMPNLRNSKSKQKWSNKNDLNYFELLTDTLNSKHFECKFYSLPLQLQPIRNE